jgi:hypothetical protein
MAVALIAVIPGSAAIPVTIPGRIQRLFQPAEFRAEYALLPTYRVPGQLEFPQGREQSEHDISNGEFAEIMYCRFIVFTPGCPRIAEIAEALLLAADHDLGSPAVPGNLIDSLVAGCVAAAQPPVPAILGIRGLAEVVPAVVQAVPVFMVDQRPAGQECVESLDSP